MLTGWAQEFVMCRLIVIWPCCRYSPLCTSQFENIGEHKNKCLWHMSICRFDANVWHVWQLCGLRAWSCEIATQKCDYIEPRMWYFDSHVMSDHDRLQEVGKQLSRHESCLSIQFQFLMQSNTKWIIHIFWKVLGGAFVQITLCKVDVKP